MDARLRQLLRTWETTGDREAEAQYLAARLRAGDLSWSAIECAAYLGDEVCRGLLGEDMLGYLPPATGVSAFLHAFPFPDRQAYLRVAHVILRQYVPHVVGLCRPEFEAGLAPLWAWIECPCESHSAAAAVAAAAMAAAYPRIERPSNADGPMGMMARDLYSHLLTWTEQGVRGSSLSVRISGRAEDAALREELMRVMLPWAVVRSPPPEPLAGPVESYRSWTAEQRARADEQRQRRLRAERDPEALDLDRAMDPARASGLLDRLEPSLAAREQLTNDQAARVVRAYLEAGGWKARGVQHLDSPSGRRRVRVQKKQLVLLEPVQGEWQQKACLIGRELPLNRAGELILASMRAARSS